MWGCVPPITGLNYRIRVDGEGWGGWIVIKKWLENVLRYTACERTNSEWDLSRNQSKDLRYA